MSDLSDFKRLVYEPETKALRKRCARLQQALRELRELREDMKTGVPVKGWTVSHAPLGEAEIGRRIDEILAGLGTPTDDPRCPELNPKSTSEDRCERPAGHSGDHVSVSHSGRVKVYPSKWDTPAVPEDLDEWAAARGDTRSHTPADSQSEDTE